MHRRSFLSLAAATAAAVATSAQAQEPVDPKTKLVVADQSELVRNLLEASGERKKLGFQLELPNFAGGPAIFEAIRAGVLDIAYVGDTPPIQARAAGTLLPIVATLTREVAQYRLVSRPGLVIEKLADLQGKKVSYVEGSGRQVFLIEALNRAGLTLQDVELVRLRVADLPDALRSRAVDVAVLMEPFVTRLGKQAGATPVRDPLERQLLPTTSYLYARQQVLADPQKAAAIAQFIGAFVRAGQWSNRNETAWGQHYFTGFQRLDADSAAAIIQAQSPWVAQTSREAIPHHQKLIDILHKAASIPTAFDAKGSFVDTFDSVIAANR